MNPNIHEHMIIEDRTDTEEEGPNYFLMGGPNPAYCRKACAELQPATLHLLLS